MVSFLPSCLFYLPNFCASMALSSSFLCPFCVVDALSTANACISSLKAELEASRKAFDVVAATKTTAEKFTKSALAKAKKAEKALADANQERIQREQAITKRLNKISAFAGGKYHAFPFFADLPILILADLCFLIFCLCPFVSLDHTGVSLAPLQPDDDPLMAAVNLLESNWISIQKIFELASRVLTRIFIGLWPKQKADVPAADLKKLAIAFNTPEDPILPMKSLSVKRGAEGAIALTYAHGEEVNWAVDLFQSCGIFSRRRRSTRLASCRLFLLQRLLRPLLRQFLRLRRQVGRCLLPTLVLPLSRLFPLWSLMLRWRRLSLPS
jgi:hypothetical protein